MNINGERRDGLMRENGKPYEGPSIQLRIAGEFELELTWRNSLVMAYADSRLNHLRHVTDDDEVYTIAGEPFQTIAEVLRGRSFPLSYKPCIKQAREDFGERFGEASLFERIHVSPFYSVYPSLALDLPQSPEPAVLTWYNTRSCLFEDDYYNHVRYRNSGGGIDVLSNEKLLKFLAGSDYPYEFRPEVDEQTANWFVQAEVRKTPAEDIVRRIVESD